MFENVLDSAVCGKKRHSIGLIELEKYSLVLILLSVEKHERYTTKRGLYIYNNEELHTQIYAVKYENFRGR